MTVRTRTPNTRTSSRPPEKVAAHTRDMLESILRPHSLEELYALVGSFPFKAVKVVKAGALPPGTSEVIGVGEVIELIGPGPQRTFITTNYHLDTDPYVVSDCKIWRLAASED